MGSALEKEDKGARKLGELLCNTVKTAKRTAKKNKNLSEKWKKAAGQEISEHTEVEGIKKGKLYVKVDTAVWLHHITSFKRERLVKCMQNEYKQGFISDIKLYVGVLDRNV